MNLKIILSLSTAVAAATTALFWHQLTPPTCAATGATLTRAEAFHAARAYIAHQNNDQARGFRTLQPDFQGTHVPITPELIAIVEPDCCSIVWDLTRYYRRTLARRAHPAYMDALATFVRVEITNAELLPPLVISSVAYIPVTACGQAETIVRDGNGWVEWQPSET